MEYKDYYQTLGVSRSAHEDEIRKAYRKLAKQYHPDRNRGNRAAEEKFKEINEAYEVLSDPQKKARYDQVGSDYQQWQRSGTQGGFDWSQYAGGMPQGGSRVEYADLSDMFGISPTSSNPSSGISRSNNRIASPAGNGRGRKPGGHPPGIFRMLTSRSRWKRRSADPRESCKLETEGWKSKSRWGPEPERESGWRVKAAGFPAGPRAIYI